jgi:hypothetical protein
VERLLDRLTDRLDRQAEQCADPGGGGRAEMGDVVDLVLMQADALHEIDLDFIGRSQAAHEAGAGQPAMLRDGQHRRNVVAGMGIVCGQERVVEIQLADGDPIGPGGPLRRYPLRVRQSEYG